MSNPHENRSTRATAKPLSSPQSPPIEIDALIQAESLYRHALLSEAADTAVRLRLAWCLFVQAVHEAGRESMLAAICLETDAAETLRTNSGKAKNRSVEQLLKDCLRQSTMVGQLSNSPRERAEAEMLQSLVGLCGAEKWKNDADIEANRRLYNVTRALLSESGSFSKQSSLKRIRHVKP